MAASERGESLAFRLVERKHDAADAEVCDRLLRPDAQGKGGRTSTFEAPNFQGEEGGSSDVREKGLKPT